LYTMKKSLIFAFLLMISLCSNAQVDLSVNFNDTHSGRSVTLHLSKNLNANYEIGGGIRYNINRIRQSDDQRNIFMNRLYATKPIHYWGVDGFVHRDIFNKWEHVKPFLFYDVQLSYSTTRNSFFISAAKIKDESIPEQINLSDFTNFGPFLWVEQNVGIGFKVDFTKKIFMTQRIGVGADLIFGSDDQLIRMMVNKFAWEFGGLVNVGFGMHF
jgi:hypothetical protein